MGLFFEPLGNNFVGVMGLFFGPLGIFLWFLENKKDAQRPYDRFGGCIKPYRAIWTHFRQMFMAKCSQQTHRESQKPWWIPSGRQKTRRPPPCPSTALHRHDKLAKYHPVPWLRWPNVSWHQVFHLPEPIVNLINMHLSWIHRESIVNLLWIYREHVPDASSWRMKFGKNMEFGLKWVHMARLGTSSF